MPEFWGGCFLLVCVFAAWVALLTAFQCVGFGNLPIDI